MIILQNLLRAAVVVAVWSTLSLGADAQGRGQNQQSAEDQAPRQKLIAYLDGLANSQLNARKQAVAQIQTRADEDRRKAMVREKILHLIGGLPESHGPVAVKQFGTLTSDGFRVEKIAYESLPGFWVTADLYVPATGSSPFPAVLLSPGHGAPGKLEDWTWGSNLARMGIMALAYDPFGQGERLQYFDPELKASKIGGPTGEHGEANIPALLIGDQLSRYWVHDAMRGVDYLAARKDVDASRIGAFGCSGGGTATAYFAALDDRVKVAMTACYITSFQELLPAPAGVQDAEQTIPNFIQQGMDFGDWVELFAPKPYAIISTENDMFPLAGAKQTYEEAKRIYGLYGAEDKLQWITGPGGHGNLMPISSPILTFLARHLNNSTAQVTYTAVKLEHREDLICTPTGQVSTSIGSETVYSLNRKRAQTLLPAEHAVTNRADIERLQTRLRQEIRTITAVTAEPGAKPPSVSVTATEPRQGYRVENLVLRGEDGIDVPGYAGIPERDAAKPAILMLGSLPKERFAVAGGDFDRLVQSGRIVMVLQPRPTPAGTESIKSPLLGVFNLLSLRAFLVGKTIVGMRMDDAIHAVDWLSARKDVDASALTAYGEGSLGMVLLHAAALDLRIKNLAVENSLAAYRMVVDQPIHRNVSEVVLPGVLRKYDVGDLLLAEYPRNVTVINPQDAVGATLTEPEFRKTLAYVFDSDRNLGSAQRVRVLFRGARDPLPID
jgi:cephalosporin-C deacetylase-like acetyl esterase